MSKGNAHLRDLSVEDMHAGFRKRQKASQANIALASRAALSRRRAHQKTSASLRGAPDSEILAANFKLSDAQEMVARQHGVDSWQALRVGLFAIAREVKLPLRKVTLVAAEPQLLVIDIKTSCKFFVEKRGFSIVFSYGVPPYYAQVGLTLVSN